MSHFTWIHPYMLLCFVETWLDNGCYSSVYFPDMFTVYRCDRKNQNLRRSGGVAILVHHSLRSKVITFDSTFHSDEMSEFLAVEVQIRPKPLIIYVCYLSEFNYEIALQHYHRISFIVGNNRDHKVIVTGDFNLHDIVWTTDDDIDVYLPHALMDTNINGNRSRYNIDALDFLNKMLSLTLSQISNLRNDAGNVLDLVFVNNSSEFRLTKDNHTIIEKEQQDSRHVPHAIEMDCLAGSSSDIETVTVYLYKRGNYERMAQELEAINFQHEFKIRDIDAAYEFFVDTMKSLIERNVPKSTFKKYSNKPKWWTPQLQKLKNRRDKLYKRKSVDSTSTADYETAQKTFNDESDRRFKEHILHTQENIKDNPAEFWKFAKMNGGNEKYPDKMIYDGRVSNSMEETVNLFAEYFESIYVPDDENWNFDDNYNAVSGAYEISLSLFDIEAAINSLDWKSGAGPDEIKPLVIKMCASTVAWPIWLLYQKSFDVGRIAAASKMSRVVPVYKRKGNKTEIKNYRVVAIQTVLLKIHEIAVKRKLSEIIQPQLNSAQHGFRNKKSVVTNLMGLSILAHEAFERQCQLDLCYNDYEAAFDKVVIRLLVVKFARFGIGRKTAKWLWQYLIGRTNYVQIENFKSRQYDSPSGVPPGSSLGPLMFTVFINDVVEVVEFARILLFADDMKLAAIIYDFGDVHRMQKDIDNVNRWNLENRLYFNKGKCNIFSIYRHDPSFIKADYTMGDHVIQRVEEMNDLGFLVNRWFLPGSHIEKMLMKCNQMVGCIKHYSNGNFTKETQRILYVAYVRSRLEFASPIWNPAAQVYVEAIESIQKQFVIYLLESRSNATSYRLAPYEDRCKQLKLQSLEMRRKAADAMLAYDIYTGNIVDDLITPKFVRNESFYDLRRSTLQLLVEPRFSTMYMSGQPVVRLIRLVNEFKSLVAKCNNRNVFRNEIMKELGL